MEKLLNEKLEAILALKSFTEEIMGVSLKTDYDKVNSMIEERQSYIEKINNISEKISENLNDNKKEYRELKREIRESLKEVADMDNLIRKNINNELNNTKNILNQPINQAGALNFKA